MNQVGVGAPEKFGGLDHFLSLSLLRSRTQVSHTTMSAHYVESLENGHAGQRSRFFDHPQSNFVTGSECIVGFDGPSDPYQPRNWSSRKKLLTTALYGLITMTATWTTSM